MYCTQPAQTVTFLLFFIYLLYQQILDYSVGVLNYLYLMAWMRLALHTNYTESIFRAIYGLQDHVISLT